MKSYLRRAVIAGAAVAAASMAVTRPATGQASRTQAYTPSHLRSGEPDFRGIWQVRTTTDQNIEGHPGGKGVAPSRSAIVDPADGKLPYQPSALARRAENFRNRLTADPQTKCYQAGVPRATYLGSPLQIVQSAGNLAIIYQDVHTYRVIYLDGRPHFDRVDWWMGDSRGQWDGDTLVVDVVDLNDQTWLDRAGNFHSEAMHVVERYTLTGPDTLRYEARIEDPKVFTKPWTMRVVLDRHKEPGFRIVEDECEEDGRGGRHHVRSTESR